jgi:hypothetical protein
MLENLSNTTQEELADLFGPSTHLGRPQILPIAVPHVGASIVTASGSGAQASNNKSTACPPGRASPKERTCIDAE